MSLGIVLMNAGAIIWLAGALGSGKVNTIARDVSAAAFILVLFTVVLRIW